ncbi:MAG: phosphatase [Christensenellaceae bacterium]|jgi:predicted protein tyrosine phosphatase
MVEVYPHLLVGDRADFERTVRHQQGWCVVQACKEPYHRQALGYRGKGAPKDHPEYLLARRGNRLILNMVDADNPDYIPRKLVDAALHFIHESLPSSKVLVHCNQGMSRSVGIAMLYLAAFTDALPTDFGEAEAEFRRRYPNYAPAAGVRGYMVRHWADYCGLRRE